MHPDPNPKDDGQSKDGRYFSMLTAISCAKVAHRVGCVFFYTDGAIIRRYLEAILCPNNIRHAQTRFLISSRCWLLFYYARVLATSNLKQHNKQYPNVFIRWIKHSFTKDGEPQMRRRAWCFIWNIKIGRLQLKCKILLHFNSCLDLRKFDAEWHEHVFKMLTNSGNLCKFSN